MNKALANNATFVMSYSFFMLLAYYLQLANSPSVTHTLPDTGAGVASIQGMAFLSSMLVLCWICLVRGVFIGKYWLVALPVVAIAFEFIPRLSAIPYVSFSYHLLAIIIGVAFPVISGAQTESSTA